MIYFLVEAYKEGDRKKVLLFETKSDAWRMCDKMSEAGFDARWMHVPVADPEMVLAWTLDYEGEP